MNSNATSYTQWQSPLSPELLFAKKQTPSNPTPWRGGLLFLLTMPEEENAQAIWFVDGDGKNTRISAAGFNIRTRVHEYGGAAFAPCDNGVYFCNFIDQEIYFVELSATLDEISEPVQITKFAAAADHCLQ